MNRENTFAAKYRNSYFEYDTWGGADVRNFKKSVKKYYAVHLVNKVTTNEQINIALNRHSVLFGKSSG